MFERIKYHAEESHRQTMTPAELYQMADSNGDGELSYVEYATAIYRSPKHGPVGFNKSDKDKSGTLNLKEKARDAAISLNGKWIFVLTEKGEILIYSLDGKLKDTISVGKSVEGIKVGPREDLLLLTSGTAKTVQIITLDFIQEINVSGSPFKGNADAPVAVATFNDYQ